MRSPIGPAGRWPKTVGITLRAVQRIWARTTFSRTASAPSSAPTIPRSPPRSRPSSACTSTRPPAWCSRSTKRARSRPSTAPAGPAAQAGQGGTITHDYKRHGTTTLFAALDALDGTVIGRCMAAPPPQGVHPLPNAIEREVPAGKVIHGIVDN